MDALMGLVTLGAFGVETTATYPEKKITPTNLSGKNVGDFFPVEEGSAVWLSLQTGKTVVINSFENFNRPKVVRKIVRNKRLP